MKNHIALSVVILMILTACARQGGSPSGDSSLAPGALNVADAAIADGNPAMALNIAKAVLQRDPSNKEALIHEGEAYFALERCSDSVAAFRLALKVDETSSAAETGLGRCLIKADARAAEAAFLRAVKDDPHNAAALNDLGVARDLQGNFAGAIEPYQRALLEQPGVVQTEVNLGLSLALSGDGTAALQYLGPLATGPTATPKIRENYAAALVAVGRDHEARDVLNVDLTPDQVERAMAGFSAVMARRESAGLSAAPVVLRDATQSRGGLPVSQGGGDEPPKS